jgi:phage-related protein
MDGWVKIGTKLDNKGIEQDLKKLQSELTKLEREEIKLKVKLDKSQSGLSEYQQEIEALKQSTDQELSLTVSDEQAKNVLAVEEQTLSVINAKYQKQLSTVSQIQSQLDVNKNKQQEITQSIEQTNNSLNKAKGLSNVYDQVGKSAGNIKDKMSSVISKVAKWGLALFGVRSIYSGIRSIMSTLSGYNEQIKTDLEYIKYSIAIGFEGIIKSIIQGVYTILQYINYIAMAWFGVNLFAKASADNFKKVKGGISGANKEAKELQKTLTGFDEMNILNDSGGTSLGGGGGGMAPIDPSMDLSKIDVPIPKWLEWIADNKDKVLGFFTVLGVLLGALELTQLLKTLELIGELPFWKVFESIALILGGIVAGIKAVIELLKEDSDLGKAMGYILLSIGLIMAGVLILFGAIPALITGLIIAIGFLIFTLVTKWEEFKVGLKYIWDTIIQWFKDVWTGFATWITGKWEAFATGFKYICDKIKEFFTNTWNGIKSFFTGIWNWIVGKAQGIGTAFSNIWTNVKNGFVSFWNFIVDKVKIIGTTIANAVGGTIKSVVNSIINFAEKTINGFIKAINLAIDVINAIPGVKIRTLSLLSIPRLATGGIINQPGRGISLGGGRAIGGEAGAEGVIPLTDSQAMETLGQAIGRYITINANIPVSMNGRVISREVKKINTSDSFVMNY